MTAAADRPLYRALDEPPYVVADLERQLRAIEDVATLDRLVANERAHHNRKTVIDRAEARRRALERDGGAVERDATEPAATHPKEVPMSTAVIEKDESGRSVAVDADTGEILGEIEERQAALVRPDPVATGVVRLDDFLANIDEAVKAQARLSEAWDQFVDAQLSPNDYVVVETKEGKKKVKKKSAWRKGARLFQISDEITRRDAGWEDDPSLPGGLRHFVAEYEVRAVTPWGQHSEGVGVCSTREDRFWSAGVACPNCGGPTWDNREPPGGYPEKFGWKANLPAFTCRDKACGGYVTDPAAESSRRPNVTAWAKAEHDCRGTAHTRAKNRAISDLIAAGEVSYEEMEHGGGGAGNDREPEPVARMDAPPPERPRRAAESKAPMSQPQFDEIAELLDTRDFAGHDEMRAWCERVVRGETKPSHGAAAEAIRKLQDLPFRGEVEDGLADLPF